MASTEVTPGSIRGFTRHSASTFWPDREPDELKQLATSIQRVGLLNPIIVDPYDSSVVWGRLAACAGARLSRACAG